MLTRSLASHLLLPCAFALAACAPPAKAVQPSTTTPSSGEMPAAAPAAAPIARDGMLQTGSSLMVRTVDTLSTEGAQAGTPFEGSLVSAIRDADGRELVPAGAKVFGRVVDAKGGGAIKKPRLAIGLSGIEINGRVVPLQTSVAGAEGGHGGAVKKIGAGTLIGAAAGSAAAGAAVGGAAVLLSGQNQIVIPSGTLIEFLLSQPAQLR